MLIAGVACRDFLKAENPGAIPAERLRDTTFIPLMVNGVIGEFQPTHAVVAYYSALFADELRNHHVYFEEGLINQRRVSPENGTFSFFLYTPMQRARWLADSVAGRFRALEGDSASRDLRLARVYAYSGYSLIDLAETECAAPIGTSAQLYSRSYTSAELFRFAAERFDSTLKIAAASAAAAGRVASPTASTRAVIKGADSLRNLASVGAARAYLGIGDAAKAQQYASQVAAIVGSTDFEFRVYFNETVSLGRLNNPFAQRMSGGAGLTTGSISGTPFLGIDDARVPYPTDASGAPVARPTMSGTWVVPNSPPAFSTFTGAQPGGDFAYGGYLRLASLLEAKYILAEIGGPTGSNLGGVANIDFVESRRTAFPSSTAVTPTNPTTYFDNLRDQRRRDFYLDGHRLGDLRRYKDRYSLDLFPKGSYFGSTTVTFGNQTCWPLSLAELTNNPNASK
ncbi:MAG: hypothetical protein NVS4B3_14290 [Gemmatimonadaceae bacterium]